MIAALSEPSVLRRGSRASEQPPCFWTVPPVSPRKAFAGPGDLLRADGLEYPLRVTPRLWHAPKGAASWTLGAWQVSPSWSEQSGKGGEKQELKISAGLGLTGTAEPWAAGNAAWFQGTCVLKGWGGWGCLGRGDPVFPKPNYC